MGDDGIDFIGKAHGVFGGLLSDSFVYHTADVGIALIGDDGFRVIVHFPFAVGDVLFQMRKHRRAQMHFLLHLFIPLEELDGIIAQVVGIDLTLNGFFNVGQCVLHTAAEDVGAFGVGVVPGKRHGGFRSLRAGLALQGGDLQNGAAQSLTQSFKIDIVAVFAHQINHIHRNHHGVSQLNQLGGQVEIALDVGAVDDVQNRVGMFVDKIGTGDHLLGGVGGQRINAGQILKNHIGVSLQGAFLLFHRHTGPVAHMLVGAGQNVEQGGFAAIGIAGKGNFQAHGITPFK